MARKTRKGKVYLVGAGPGDPGLLTLKGLRCIQNADVVIYDHLVAESILKHAKPKAKLVYVGKKAGKHSFPQNKINTFLSEMAKRGKTVVRLKGGDPFVFGRGGEEVLELAQAGIPFEVVPGVTSATSVPAYAGIPVTFRGMTSSFGVITGHEDPLKGRSDIDWKKISTGFGTLVFLMGIKNLGKIAYNLIKNGRPKETPVALIRWGTTPQQETLIGTLSDIADKAKVADFQPPAIFMIGEVINLRHKLNWFEKKPLFGRTIVVTRARKQASVLAESLREKGAQVIEFPTIKIAPPDDFQALDKTLRCLSSFDWIIFTSVNGVESFFNRLLYKKKDVRELAAVKICAIGPETRKHLEALGLRVDYTPKQYVADSIVRGFRRMGSLDKKRILLPRAKQAGEVLSAEIKKMGAQVKEVPVYQTKIEKVPPTDILGRIEEIDLFTFTSSSTAKNLFKIIGEKSFRSIRSRIRAASIGPVTSRTLENLGINPVVQAKEYTIPGLVQAIENYFEGKGNWR